MIGRAKAWLRRRFSGEAGQPGDEPGGQLPDAETDRTNLYRIQIAGLIGLADSLFEFTFNAIRRNQALMGLWIFAFVWTIGFIAIARIRARRGAGPSVSQPLTAAIMVSWLLISIVAGYFMAVAQILTYGYALLIMGMSGIFMMEPKRFRAIAVATFAIYLVQVSLSPKKVSQMVQVDFNTGLAVAAACVMRTFLFNLRQRELRQLATIAEQNQQLHRANTALAGHNYELNELMAVAAHDLRSPLYGLRNLLDVAAGRETAPPELYRSVLDEGSRSIATMLALVDRILKAHEAENSPGIAVRAEDLRAAAAVAAREHSMAAQSAGIVLETRCPSHPLWALLEPDALGQIMTNLLSNAVRFSPEGATIVIECRQENDKAIIAVMDAGAGIPPGEEPHLFGKFRPGSNQPLRGGRGSGLGLYISHKLAASMGGDLRYASIAGEGSKFSVILATANFSSA